MVFITSSCKYPEAAFRMLDYLGTEEMAYRSLGIEGEEWEFLPADTTEVGLDGSKATWRYLTSDAKNTCLDQMCCRLTTADFYNGEATNPNPYAEDVKPLNGRMVVLNNAALTQATVRQPLESVMPELYMSQENADELALLKTTISDTHREAMVQFVTGTKSLDTDWDSYVTSLKDLGLDDYLALMQGAYDKSAFAQ